MKLKRWMAISLLSVLALLAAALHPVFSAAPEQNPVQVILRDLSYLAVQPQTVTQTMCAPVAWSAAELPQPIRKISGVLIHTDRDSLQQILRMKEYRGSG